jgi:hypothetical protein
MARGRPFHQAACPYITEDALTELEAELNGVGAPLLV